MRRFLALCLVVTVAGWPVPAASVEPTNGVFVALGVHYATGTTPYSVAVADLNGDDKLDFVTGNVNSTAISVHLGDGAGGFAPAPGAPVLGDHVSEIRVGFVNSDALPDLVGIRKLPACCGQADQVLTWLGTAGGAFAPVVEGPLVGPEGGDGLTLADFTGDGVLDAAYANSYVLDTTRKRVFGVLAGHGDGTWTELQEYDERSDATNSLGIRAVESADLDGDGDVDLVVADSGSSAVSMWRNDGSGAFTRAAGSPIPLGASPQDLRIGDLDGNGDPDLAIGTLLGVTVLLGNGAGSFTPGPDSPVALLTPAHEVGLGDINADGRLDVVASSYDGTLRVLMGLAGGGLEPGWASPYPVRAASDLQLGDVTGDGYLDVLVTNNGGASSTSNPNPHPDTVTVLATASDNEGPVTTINRSLPAPEGGWYGPGAVSVNAGAVDVGLAGVQDFRCGFDWDPAFPPASYLSLHDFCFAQFSTHGIHHVYAAAIDRAGNLGPVAHEVVRIDLVAPVVTIIVQPDTPASGVFTEQPVVTVDGDDPDSGLADVRCSFTPATSYDDLPAGCDLPTGLGVGEHTVYAAARDLVGNESAVQTFDFEIADPNAKVVLTGNKAAGTRLAFTATIDSVGDLSAGVTFSGPASLRFDSVSGATGCSLASRTVTCPSTTLADGSSRVVTVLATPASSGPHQVAVSIDPDDADASDDTSVFAAGTSLVCDNQPTGGADVIIGTSGADILCGLSGNDSIRGLAGNDLLFGGSGSDQVSYYGAPATTVDLREQGLGTIGARSKSGSGHGRDTFTSIERARGGNGADTIIGNAAANALLGAGGIDTLKGLGGRDSLNGGSGRDLLDGGSGIDTCRQLTDVRRSCER